MFRFLILAAAVLCSLPVIGAETSTLGVGIENLLFEIDDPDAFFAYRLRMAERRDKALEARADMSAMKGPARGAIAATALANPMAHRRQVLIAHLNRRKMAIDQQVQMAGANAAELQRMSAQIANVLIELVRQAEQN